MKKLAIKRGEPASQTLQAVGAAEAAAIMGVHFSTPARMVEKGMLSASICQQRAGGGERMVAIFDGRECEENYLDYLFKVAERGGLNDRRPRAHLDSRDEVLEHLAAVEVPIAFSDACGAAEAAEILHVHASFLTRLARKGSLSGRSPWSPRGRGETRNWIFSRRSCLANVAAARKMTAAGTHVGRPRKFC